MFGEGCSCLLGGLLRDGKIEKQLRAASVGMDRRLKRRDRTRRWSRLAIASCGMVRLLAASCSTFSFCHEGSPEPEPEHRNPEPCWRFANGDGALCHCWIGSSEQRKSNVSSTKCFDRPWRALGPATVRRASNSRLRNVER
jgi:hypothetical protein